MHRRTIHENIKAFPCDYCKKRFGRNNDLKIHIKTVHEYAKDYKCNSCDKSFGQNSHLKNHIRAIHESVAKVLDKKYT